MDARQAIEIEAAECDYLRSRVESLSHIEGNPYGAQLFSNRDFPCFLVKATTSPMLNRIYGDSLADPQGMRDLLKRSAEYSAIIPMIGKLVNLKQSASLAGSQLDRLKGWTHLQFGCQIENAVAKPHSFHIEEVTVRSISEFASLHADSFKTNPSVRSLNRASFEGLLSDERARIYVLKVEGKVLAGALMYFSRNGVAYLGTAATKTDARKLGYHQALISHRITQAKERGSRIVAATALPNSQSRRNLQRAGLVVSHAQALYRLAF
jgi:predicted GNAT family acetyltransferase